MPKLIQFGKEKINDNCIVGFGNYDGFHLGHKKCIDFLVKTAKKNNSKSLLMVFNPHTLQVIKPSLKEYLIYDYKTKISELMSADLDYLVVLDFNLKISEYGAEKFIKDILLTFNPLNICIGYDNFFGHKKEGDYKYLVKYFYKTDIEICLMPIFKTGNSTILKSSLIRENLRLGRIDLVNSYLGSVYKINGVIERGYSRGKKIGFPTANLKYDSKNLIIPKNGVYYTNTIYKDKKYNSLSNIGFRPTFSGSNSDKTIETYIITEDSLELYDEIITIEFLEFIRDEKKFKSYNDLVAQIKKDINKVNNRSTNVCS